MGKGLTSASIGLLLKSRGLRVEMLKMDPYINVDPGTMNPFQHGEVFVTDDGAETDLDLGHYERFVNQPMGHRNNFTTGAIYSKISSRNAGAISTARRFRLSRTLPTKSRKSGSIWNAKTLTLF